MARAAILNSSRFLHMLAGVMLFLLVLVMTSSSLPAVLTRTVKGHAHSLVRALVPEDKELPPSIALICNNTVYPQACLTGFTSQSNPGLKNASPQKLVSIALKAALAVVHESHAFAKNCSTASSGGNGQLHVLERQAVEDCMEMMERATDQLNLAIANLSAISAANLINTGPAPANTEALLNLNVRLSASLSFQTTCADGFQFVSYGKCERAMLKRQEQVGEVLVNSLDIVRKLLMKQKQKKKKKNAEAGHRHLLAAGSTKEEEAARMQQQLHELGFPEWVYSYHEETSIKQLLLELLPPAPTVAQGPAAAASMPNSTASRAAPGVVDMVVAQDGSGDYLNISDAMNHIPSSSSWPAGKMRFVLYIRAGVYDEIVSVPSLLVNLTVLGDGMGSTVITGNNSVGSGLFNTFRTATFGVSADGFMARDITFRNTAGPEGYQAVALRGSGDHMVFYRCSFEGYQDTLYALASRQFYRDCIIQGTVDFIFGNAIASFQNCRLQARRPLRGQQNTLTAQGRKVEVDISGFSFQNCTLEAAPELASAPFSVASYLGRPWKAFSRTVFLQCFLDSLIHPAGWLAWNSSNPFTDTLFYGEFQNRGPASNTSTRVPWKGVHPLMNSSDAAFFIADNFILGYAWLPLAEVGYTSGLVV